MQSMSDHIETRRKLKSIYSVINTGVAATYTNVAINVVKLAQGYVIMVLERLYLEIKSVDYNEVYVATMQPELHEKYLKKTKELNIEE